MEPELAELTLFFSFAALSDALSAFFPQPDTTIVEINISIHILLTNILLIKFSSSLIEQNYLCFNTPIILCLKDFYKQKETAPLTMKTVRVQSLFGVVFEI